MRITSADASGVRLHRPEVQTAARENQVVRLEHLPVTDLGPRLIRIETVGVLHAEFPAAHHPEPRPYLVAKLGLDLVEISRELPVCLDPVADQIGNHLLMGRPETVFPVMAIAKAQQFLAVMDPAVRFLPELGRLNHRQEHLLGPGPVHLLADNLLDLADHPVSQGEIGIDPAGQFPNHACPDHELMTGKFRIGRDLPSRGQEHLRITHATSFLLNNFK